MTDQTTTSSFAEAIANSTLVKHPAFSGDENEEGLKALVSIATVFDTWQSISQQSIEDVEVFGLNESQAKALIGFAKGETSEMQATGFQVSV